MIPGHGQRYGTFLYNMSGLRSIAEQGQINIMIVKGMRNDEDNNDNSKDLSLSCCANFPQ